MCCEASRSLTMLPQSTSPLTSSQSSHTTSCLLQLRPQQRSTTPPTAATNPGQDGGDSKWPTGGAAELRFSRNWTNWLISGVCPSSPMDLAQTSESQPKGMETDWRVFHWEINLADFLGDLSGFSAALLSTNTTCWRRRWTSFRHSTFKTHQRKLSETFAIVFVGKRQSFEKTTSWCDEKPNQVWIWYQSLVSVTHKRQIRRRCFILQV